MIHSCPNRRMSFFLIQLYNNRCFLILLIVIFWVVNPLMFFCAAWSSWYESLSPFRFFGRYEKTSGTSDDDGPVIQVTEMRLCFLATVRNWRIQGKTWKTTSTSGMPADALVEKPIPSGWKDFLHQQYQVNHSMFYKAVPPAHSPHVQLPHLTACPLLNWGHLLVRFCQTAHAHGGRTAVDQSDSVTSNRNRGAFFIIPIPNVLSIRIFIIIRIYICISRVRRISPKSRGIFLHEILTREIPDQWNIANKPMIIKQWSHFTVLVTLPRFFLVGILAANTPSCALKGYMHFRKKEHTSNEHITEMEYTSSLYADMFLQKNGQQFLAV